VGASDDGAGVATGDAPPIRTFTSLVTRLVIEDRSQAGLDERAQ
jgi:hypothetical protein